MCFVDYSEEIVIEEVLKILVLEKWIVILEELEKVYVVIKDIFFWK